MAHTTRLYLACAATVMCSSVAGADALHGFCSDCRVGPAAGATVSGPLSDFGFWDAGQNNRGTYFIDILTPDNGGSGAPSATYSISGGGSGKAALFSSTAWTSGKLDSYLGINASPTNPLSAWLHATQALDPKAMGYWVFQANLGMTTLGTSSGTGPLLNLNSTLPPGSVVVAFLETNSSHQRSSHQMGGSDEVAVSHDNGNDQGDDNNQGNDNDQGDDNDQGNGKSNDHGKGKNSNLFTATANGGALFETAPGSSKQPPGAGGGSGSNGVPEPGTAALLITALLGFAMRLVPWHAARPRLAVLPRATGGSAGLCAQWKVILSCARWINPGSSKSHCACALPPFASSAAVKPVGAASSPYINISSLRASPMR